jgi:hypothetical protein
MSKCVVCESELTGAQTMYCSGFCKQKSFVNRAKENGNFYQYQRLRGLKRKIELINLRGGKCEKCGYCKNVAGFDFHHRIPENKKFKLDMRHLANLSMNIILEEFNKCDLLCANCHREYHSPDLDMDSVLKFIDNVDQSIIQIREVKKPNCFDCGCSINYGSTRCTPCNNNFKTNPNKPKLSILIEERKLNGVTWCSKKYGVSRRTINRWLDNKVEK